MSSWHNLPGIRTSLILVMPLLIALGAPNFGTSRSMPSADAPVLRLSGLHERVIVRRDDRGIPHIEASNEEDLFLAQGYVTASDRLWQMDLLRRLAGGRLSELFGKSLLEEDKRHRRLGFSRISELQVTNASPAARGEMDAYARGVNAWIDGLDEKTLPLEFRILKYRPQPWTAADTLLIAKLLAEDLSTTWRSDLMRAGLADLAADKRAALLPESSPLDVILVGGAGPEPGKSSPAAAPTIRGFSLPAGNRADLFAHLEADRMEERRGLELAGLFAESLAASNNWVVSGGHTSTGKPLLANDPHLAPSVPSIWYMVHLASPSLTVAGVTFPGCPGVVLGHNERIAWGATNLGPDVQDLYLEKFDPQNPRRYRTPAGWVDADVRQEEIKVRKTPIDPETESIWIEVTVTRHGPIIFESAASKESERYALRWTMLDAHSDPFAAFTAIDRAHNWKDFCKALKIYPGPTQNFIYADVDGHIGYYGAGRIPIRSTGDGSLPCDGSTNDGEWTRFIPFENLPHLLDPPSGVIVSANSRMAGAGYPYHLTHEWAEPYRARRIHDLLLERQKLSIDDMLRIQSDVYSMAGASFAREIVRLARETSGAAEVADGWESLPDLLEKWDGRMSVASRAALIVYEIRRAFGSRLLANALGPDRVRAFHWFSHGTFLDRIIAEKPREWLPPEFKGYSAFVHSCWLEARAGLTRRIGTEESTWTWGNPAIGPRWWKHPLTDAPFVGGQFKIPFVPTPGIGDSIATVNVGPAVSMRMVADTSNWDNTVHGIALGESGDPGNPHYRDQFEDWRNVRPRAFAFTLGAVSKAAQTAIILSP